MEKIIKSILEWWKEHESDTEMGGDEDEYNVYESEPEFVTLAKEWKDAKDNKGVKNEN